MTRTGLWTTTSRCWWGRVRRHCARLLCVVNGELTEAGRAKLAPVCDEILMRPNEGLDVTGYKEGFFHLEGELEQFDELLFFNQTVFGPLYPLGELFDEMAGRDLDFWGLSRHKGLQRDLTGTVWEKVEYGYIPPHVQSYFFAVRGELLRGGALGEYWRALPVIHDYIEAVSFHEMRFTKFFADQGYRWQVYLDCGDWERFLDYPLMGAPARLLESARLPLVKRKSFITPPQQLPQLPAGGRGVGAALRDRGKDRLRHPSHPPEHHPHRPDDRSLLGAGPQLLPPSAPRAGAAAPGGAPRRRRLAGGGALSAPRREHPRRAAPAGPRLFPAGGGGGSRPGRRSVAAGGDPHPPQRTALPP